MKKFISLLLSLIMVMSLSVTAFAADTNIESTEEGSNSASTSVKANYTPASAKAEITNLTVSGGNSYDPDTNTYTVTPNGEKLTITVSGTNFENLTAENKVSHARGISSSLNSGWWDIDTANNTASQTFNNNDFRNCTTAYEIRYKNDDGKNWIYTGIYVVYDSGIPDEDKAKIDSVAIEGYAGYDKDSNTYTITPNSGDVTITVSGTKFENLTVDNMVLYAPAIRDIVIPDYGWTIDTANNTASQTVDNSTFQNCTTAFKIRYSNDGGNNWIDTGIHVVYKTEFISVDVAWGAMSFTYNDADEANSVAEGWTCEDGANQITVTNKGEVTVDAAVKYEAAADYAAITGTFDSGSATLAQDENKIFTLSLSGKPESALNDATIGTATVTITKSSD